MLTPLPHPWPFSNLVCFSYFLQTASHFMDIHELIPYQCYLKLHGLYFYENPKCLARGKSNKRISTPLSPKNLISFHL